MKIIIYHTNIIRIGGVETFTYNMCKLLAEHYDVLLLYKTCHREQLSRLAKYCRCEIYDPAKSYECDKLILASSWVGYPEAIKAKDYIQIIHANYKELLKIGYKYDGWKKTTKHIAVSEAVAKNFEEIYKIKCDVLYNILDEIQPTKPILKLISATRLSYEKGYSRMVRLAKELKKRNVKFRWIIFTDREQYKISDMDMEEVIYMKPRYDVWDYLKEADYGVQLSDTEGYSYFINECLQYGTPVIATAFDSVYESVVDGKSGHILDFDLFKNGTEKDWDKCIEKIQKVPKKFIYEPKTTVQTWIEVLGEPAKKEDYVYQPEKIVIAEVLKKYFDVVLNKTTVVGETIEVPHERALYLADKKFIKIKEIFEC